jgi:hypothetical protein
MDTTAAELFGGLRLAWSGFSTWLQYRRFGRIQITSPRSTDFLQNPKRLDAERVSYEVRGKLNRLPDDSHEIWLLTEDHCSGRVWPQGFEAVQFDRDKGEWSGRVHSRDQSPKIVAVVAPPSVVDFFKYYQRMGAKTNYEGLDRIPPACKKKDSVQARLPAASAL